MDVLTPAGQKTLQDEARAQEIFEINFPGWRYMHTPKNRPADVDAVVIHEGQVSGVIETKCRYDVDLKEFNQRYNGQWLVTFDKLIKGRDVATALQVPLVGFLYLVRSDVLLMITIFENGSFVPKIRMEETVTQKTVNGGRIVRTNAFIDMSTARILRI